MKFRTEIPATRHGTEIGFCDRITLLGSCFSDNIGQKLEDAGFNVLRNPFGALYNPASVASAIRRLDSGCQFTKEDCVEMGAGSRLICSFEHHTSFARESIPEFLDNANMKLRDSKIFWDSCNKVIITLGTAFVWNSLKRNGMAVSNCLKRPGTEFSRSLLSVQECVSFLTGIVTAHPEKEFIFTVSPIRHLSDGAHANTVSKSTLQLSADAVINAADNAGYFPAYEILMDDLRDYRFYAKDMIHPSEAAVDYIWEKFIETYTSEKDIAGLRENEKSSLRARHRSLR